MAAWFRSAIGAIAVSAVTLAPSPSGAFGPPDVVGRRVAHAEQRCRLAGFRLVHGTYFIAPQFWRDDIDESLVALTWPASHAVGSEGTSACWTLKRAPDGAAITNVPSIVGIPYRRAAELLRSAGLVLLEGGPVPGDPPIIGSFPGPGTAVYQGTAVYLRTAKDSSLPASDADRDLATDSPTNSTPSKPEIATPEATVDWAAGTVTVVIPLKLPAGPTTLRLAAADDAEQADLTLKRVERGLSISGSVAALRAALEPGTRSLPVDVAAPETSRESGATNNASANPAAEPANLVHYRADLPAIDIARATKRTGDESTGPTLSLWVKQLTPDFVIDAAFADEPEKTDESENSDAVSEADGEAATAVEYRPLAIGPGAQCGAKITLAEPDGELGVRIDLEFPALPPATARRYRLAIVDAFGSRTRTLEARQEGADIDGNLRTFLPAIPAPVDEFVAAPHVELLEYAEAARLAREAGLVPAAWSTARQAYVETSANDARFVVAQGIGEGRPLRRGELLLLAVEGDAESSAIGDRASGRAAAAAGDPFGFVAVPERGSMLYAGFEAGTDEEGAQIAGGQAPPSSSDETPPAGDPNEAPPSPVEGGTLPLAAGAWVPLDPRLDPVEAESRASMKAIVDAVSSRLDGGEPPGVAGRLLGEVVREFDDELAGSGSNPRDLEAAVGAITDQVAERLQVNLSADDRSRLVADCAAAHSVSSPAGPTGDASAAGAVAEADRGSATGPDAAGHELDRNKNGYVADDVAAWILARLAADKHLSPTALGQVVPGALGTPVAVLTSQPSKPPPGAKPPEPMLTVVDEEIKIPAGKPSIGAETSPTKVRVPPLEEAQTPASYMARLRAVGLTVAKEGKLFEKDKILAAHPAAKEWVAPSTPIKLELERLVPDVTKRKVQEAEEAVREKEFAVDYADPQRSYRKDDVVAAQSPETGAYRPRNAKIELTIKRPVPPVVGKKVADAVAQLRTLEFEILLPETRLETDVVAEQSPAGGTPADIGSEVTFLRLETTMPDLAGASIAQAKTLKQAREILGERALKYSLAEPKSDYLQAKVFAQTPKFGAKIDREKETAELKLVIPVPEVAEPVTLAKAIGSLQTFTLGYAVTSSKAQDDDYVMELDVAQGERRFASGGKSYVYPGAKMVLKIGRPVPRVDEREWAGGLAAVREKGFDVSTPLGSGTHVHSTEPIGGKLADLRYPVRVKAGIKVPPVDGLPWATAERVLGDVELGLRASATTDVETDDRSRFNTLWVAADSQQTPAAGRIILKGSVRDVSVRAVRYLERRVRVPQVVGMTPTEAGRRIEERGLVVKQTVVPQTTTDRTLAGRQTVVFQAPPVDTPVVKATTVQIRVAQWTYQGPLTTYAVRRHTEAGRALALAASAETSDEGAGATAPRLFTCEISADRRTISVTSERLDAQGTPQTVRGTLIDDQAVFQNKRCLSYSIDTPRKRWGLRIPYDGVGDGQSLEDGVWLHVAPGMNPLRFDLQKPTFK